MLGRLCTELGCLWLAGACSLTHLGSPEFKESGQPNDPAACRFLARHVAIMQSTAQHYEHLFIAEICLQQKMVQSVGRSVVVMYFYDAG
jgi:hypothetical protein